MELPNKTLRQHRAVLTAKQGDRQSPATGTFFAHRQRLLAELTQSLIEHGLVRSHQAAAARRDLIHSAATRHGRDPGEIASDLRMVDAEISLLDERIEEIDRLLAANERPGYV